MVIVILMAQTTSSWSLSSSWLRQHHHGHCHPHGSDNIIMVIVILLAQTTSSWSLSSSWLRQHHYGLCHPHGSDNITMALVILMAQTTSPWPLSSSWLRHTLSWSLSSSWLRQHYRGLCHPHGLDDITMALVILMAQTTSSWSLSSSWPRQHIHGHGSGIYYTGLQKTIFTRESVSCLEVNCCLLGLCHPHFSDIIMVMDQKYSITREYTESSSPS